MIEMNNNTYVFIDEFGTPALNIENKGVEPYFIYVAVLIGEEHLDKAKASLKAVRNKYNQGAPLKANRIPNDDKGNSKRVNILKAFSGDFPHIVQALIVDKKSIESKGLAYKKVFIKYFNGVLSRIYNSPQYTELHVVLDKTGRPAFVEELSSYMKKHLYRDELFSNNTFTLKDDKDEEPLLQIADFYAGCIGKIFCNKINDSQSKALYDYLKEYTFCEWFPREHMNYLFAKNAGDNKYNNSIVQIATKSANAYLESPKSTDSGREIVKHFLTENGIYPYRIISSREIRYKLKLKNIQIASPIEEISHLRDEGVLIVSPLGKKGYKLPCNIEEVKSFYDRISTNIIPQLRRAFILNRVLAEGSTGKINILREMEQLNNLVELVASPLGKHLRTKSPFEVTLTSEKHDRPG